MAEKKILERSVKGYLNSEVKQIGGEIRKVRWEGRNHAPDCAIFYGGTWWVETKRSKGKAREGQLREHTRMRKQGANVRVIDTIEGVDSFINELRRDKHEQEIQAGIVPTVSYTPPGS